jgi:hypothetical protein
MPKPNLETLFYWNTFLQFYTHEPANEVFGKFQNRVLL